MSEKTWWLWNLGKVVWTYQQGMCEYYTLHINALVNKRQMKAYIHFWMLNLFDQCMNNQPILDTFQWYTALNEIVLMRVDGKSNYYL